MCSLRSAAGHGHSSAAQAPRGCLAAPPVEEPSVAVARRSSRAPLPPGPWWLSSGSVERRSAARCGASQCGCWSWCWLWVVVGGGWWGGGGWWWLVGRWGGVGWDGMECKG